MHTGLFSLVAEVLHSALFSEEHYWCLPFELTVHIHFILWNGWIYVRAGE